MTHAAEHTPVDSSPRAAPGMRALARAYAKVNLALGVGPPLPASAGPKAGFHPICSWFACVSLWEDLELEALPAGAHSEYRIHWAEDAPRPSPIDWPIEKDLAVRAHRALEAHIGASLPVRMNLRKRIPVGGGLGGGSSDAAAMLLALTRLFRLTIPVSALHDLSRPLGSDIAFFLDEAGPAAEASLSPHASDNPEAPPRPAIVSGLGDRIERIPRAHAHMLLIVPSFGCPTGPVYRAFDSLIAPKADPAAFELESLARVRALVSASTTPCGSDTPAPPNPTSTSTIPTRELFNDLWPAACRVAPDLPRIADDIGRMIASTVHMTGSGSTLFTLHPSAESARAAATRLAGEQSLHVATIPVRLL